MIPDHDARDLLAAIRVEIVLVGVEDPRARPDPDAITDLERLLAAQMAGIQESLAADPDPRSGKSEQDHRAEIRAQPGIGADLDARALRHGDVYPALPTLGVDTGAEREPGARGESEMSGGEVRARVGRDFETGMARREAAKSQAIEMLDRLQAPAGGERDEGDGIRPTTGRRVQPGRPSGGR